MARREAAEQELAARKAEQLAAQKRWQEEQATDKQRNLIKGAKWGTKEAKRCEIERLRREIEAKKK